MAVANYNDTYGTYPPAVIYDSQGQPAHSWRVLILPFLEQRDLFDDYSFDEPWNGPNNSKLAERMPVMMAFAGLELKGRTCTNFVAITGEETVWPKEPISWNSLNDPGSTIQFAEYDGPPIHWMSPVDLNLETMSFQIGTANSINSQYQGAAVGMADGSVQRLGPEISREELRALCTRTDQDTGPSAEQLNEIEDGRLRPLKNK